MNRWDTPNAGISTALKLFLFFFSQNEGRTRGSFFSCFAPWTSWMGLAPSSLKLWVRFLLAFFMGLGAFFVSVLVAWLAFFMRLERAFFVAFLFAHFFAHFFARLLWGSSVFDVLFFFFSIARLLCAARALMISTICVSRTCVWSKQCYPARNSAVTRTNERASQYLCTVCR